MVVWNSWSTGSRDVEEFGLRGEVLASLVFTNAQEMGSNWNVLASRVVVFFRRLYTFGSFYNDTELQWL